LVIALPRAFAASPTADERLRARIAEQLAEHYPGFSQAARDPQTAVRAVPAPFESARIWRFEKFLPTRPLIFYVGVTGRDQVLLLTDEPKRFNQLVARERAPRTAAEAVARARLFDETTSKADQRHLLIQSVDEIPFRPGLNAAQAELRDQAKASLAPRIRPPRTVRLGNGGWRVTAYAIDDDALVEISFDIDRTGAIQARSHVLRDDLPLVYAN
jgi:hypothetical protein